MFTLLEESIIAKYDLNFDVSDKNQIFPFCNYVCQLFEDLPTWSMRAVIEKYGAPYVFEKVLVSLARGQPFGNYLGAAIKHDWKIYFTGTPEEWWILKQDEEDGKVEKLRENKERERKITNVVLKNVLSGTDFVKKAWMNKN